VTDRLADGEAAGRVADADGEAGADDGAAEPAPPPGPAGLAAASLCPLSETARAITAPTAASAPAETAAPERKLISSMRA
jgi:hypothetical protein